MHRRSFHCCGHQQAEHLEERERLRCCNAGLSTQLKGYHCLAFKNCPGTSCICEVRQGCGSSKAAADTTAACLYGVKDANECPVDSQVSQPTSSAISAKSSITTMCILVVAAAMASTVTPRLWQ